LLWVNSAIKELTSKNVIFGIKGFHKRVYFPELEVEDTSQSTVDGVAYIDVPTGALVIREVDDTTNDRLLEPTSWGEYKSYSGRADADSEGQPTQWVRRGQYIYLYPTPDSAYAMTVDHRKKITSDISGDSVTDIGAEWDDAIVALATYKGLRWMNEQPDLVNGVKQEFMEIAADILGIYFQDEVGRTGYMGLAPGYNK